METVCFAAILLMFTSPQTESLSIKRRSLRSSDDLTAALAVLRRHKRQTSDIGYLRNYLIDNQDRIPESYLNVLNDNYGLNLEKYYPQQPISENILDREMLQDAYKNTYKDVGPFVTDESDERNIKGSRNVPTRAELAEIFGDFNKKVPERTHKRQIYMHHPTSEYESRKTGLEHSPKSNKQKVSESALKEMFEKSSEKDNNDEKSAEKERTPVSTEELKNVFGDESKNKDDQSKAVVSPQQPSPVPTKDNKAERSVPTEGERFQELTHYENMANVKEKKKKRVEKRDYDSEMELSQTVLDLTRTVAALRDEVTRLKIAEALEDKENDLLASALKQATLGQLQGTEGNLKKEYLDIQNAIRVEEQLQAVRTPKNEEEMEEPGIEGEEEVVAENLPFVDKRQGNLAGMVANDNTNNDQWYENPVEENVGMDEDDADKTLREFAAKALIYKQQLKNNENEKAIEELVSNLSPEERQELAEGYLNQGPFDVPSNENNCPGVNYLTSQCSVAKMAGLKIDDDAMNLCNRHEICYTCGETLSFSQTTCDAGFRGDVIEMCGNDTECIENGAKFLWFLKSEHTYNYGYLNKCDSGCVKDFIKGL
ncbi:uncharacterized protein LOC133181003 isoform X1 [Saccostrea echinata]|uniref:uncharacterized protein LOC133181003 isoform X1 n=1 Tax=Saccostrea echinata TaxID=191078 RepID=UPI002A81B2DB|nr:uncharacterized protein LOC133181003 isoform X1 [Saccostrea echinata]XP_061171490.1 uncharacterized protein LOC133181003 isoform X1 [Saccostrea echinata]